MESIALALLGGGITGVAFFIAAKLFRLELSGSRPVPFDLKGQILNLRLRPIPLGFSAIGVAVVGLALLNFAQLQTVDSLQTQVAIRNTVERMSELQEPSWRLASASTSLNEAAMPGLQSELGNLQQKLLRLQKKAGDLPASAYRQLGLSAAAERRTDDAIMYFTKAGELDPYDARSYTSLGVLYYFKGEEAQNQDDKKKYNEKAIAAHQRAIQIDPNFAKAYSNLGISLDVVGAISDAIQAEKKAIAIDPNYAEAYYNLACIYSLRNERKEALNWLTQAIEHGYTALGEMRNDTSLNNIRGSEEYRKLDSQLAAKLGLAP